MEFEVVVVATSLGGLEALGELLAPLSDDFPVPIVVVQHVDARAQSHLPELLARQTRLAVRHAVSGEPLRASTIYVAPPGLHLLIDADRNFVLSSAAPVAFSRPAADPLFVSAASAFGHRTLGVILTGRLSDGTAGARVIQHAGGVVLAQAPATCRAAAMPQAAISGGVVDLVLPLASLGAALQALVAMPFGRAHFGFAPRAA
jgi:two-component system chemotaxis response regulator CheB